MPQGRFADGWKPGFRLLTCMCLLAAGAFAADFSVPAQVPAGKAIAITTTGHGSGTLYLIGPTARSQHSVRLGDAVRIDPVELREAGRYVVVLRSGNETGTKSLVVTPAEAASLSFFAQPSRVPASRPGVISGTVFVFDHFQNLVTAPVPVRFELTLGGMTPMVRTLSTRNGVAWTRMDSGRKEGPAQFVASIGDIAVRRVVQQVAAEPCNLRMRAQPSKNGILVETDPVRDCSGNAVPDGSIVTFTETDASGKSTVDARIKRGVARAELPASRQATITVAAGVVAGNEIHWGGGR